MDAKIAELKAGAHLTRTWIHMDMDAFFAAVEELDNPSLVLLRMPIVLGQKAITLRVSRHGLQSAGM